MQVTWCIEVNKYLAATYNIFAYFECGSPIFPIISSKTKGNVKLKGELVP